MRAAAWMIWLLLASCLADAQDVRLVGGVLNVNGVALSAVPLPAYKGFQRIQKLLGAAGQKPALSVRQGVRGSATVLLGSRPLMVLTRADGAAAGKKPNILAMELLIALAGALALPPLSVQASVTMPVGGVVRLPVAGQEARSAVAHGADGLKVSYEKLVLRVEGALPGDFVVRLKGPTAERLIKVAVLPWAARLPQTVQAEIVGNPATSETVRRTVVTAVGTLRAEPGARTEIGAFAPRTIKLAGSNSFSVPVRVSAPGSYSAVGRVTVIVKSLPLGMRKEKELWYSNYPEKLYAPRQLFSEVLSEGKPARLLYHHQNAGSATLRFVAQLENRNEMSVKVALLRGEGPPHPDPVRAGYRAGDFFLQNWSIGSAEVFTIPAGSSLALSNQELAPGKTASGLVTLRVVSPAGANVRLRAQAVAAGGPTLALFSRLPPLSAEPVQDTPHVYPSPYVDSTIQYTVGGPQKTYRLGERPVSNRDTTRVLQGNYGVIYRLRFEIKNPTSQAARLELAFEASAGYSGAIFLSGGRLVRLPLIGPKQQSRINTITLEPQTDKTVELVTLPLSGSSYPATLILRPIGSGP